MATKKPAIKGTTRASTADRRAKIQRSPGDVNYKLPPDRPRQPHPNSLPGEELPLFLLLAAHEIRNDEERVNFFKQLKNVLSPAGKIIVVEHQRDIYNFMAYNFPYFLKIHLTFLIIIPSGIEF